MLHDAVALADDGPVAIRYPTGTARQVDEHEVGVGLAARRELPPTATARCACWPSASWSATPRRPPTTLAADGHRRRRCGTCAAAHRSTRTMIADAAAPPAWWSPPRTASATAASA